MIINLLATWIPAIGIASLGGLKLTGNRRVAAEMSKLGRIKTGFDVLPRF